MLSAHFARTATALVGVLGLSCTALAQPYDFTMRLDRIIGTPVHTARGEVLGSIKDLIVDTRTLRIEYVVVERTAAGQNSPAVYPVGALLAGDRGELLLDGAEVVTPEASSAAGGTTLAPAQRRNFAFAAAELGRRDELLVDLIDGTLRLPQE
jgi:sporulation protein YlmC with PRC-barrel domain